MEPKLVLDPDLRQTLIKNKLMSLHAYVYTCARTSVHTHGSVDTSIYRYVCIYTYMYIYVHIYIWMYLGDGYMNL